MRILALNGSPRLKASSTYHILKPFLEGMEAAGAETDVIHIRRLNLEACVGCYTCWVRTPGMCTHDDSMTQALEKYNAADMIVFGTPLYHFTMSGLMKNFIDRTLPRFEPWLIPHHHVPGVSGHPERFRKPNKMFLISPCGFPEFEHFEPLLTTFRYMARMENWEYVGEILRPGAEPLSRRSLQGLFAPYYDLVRQAGEQVVSQGYVSDELQAELRRDLFPGGKEGFYQASTGYWTDQMDRFKVPSELRHAAPLQTDGLDRIPMAPVEAVAIQPSATMAPIDAQPDPFTTAPTAEADIQMKEEHIMDTSNLTCRDLIAGMPTTFDAQVAGDLDADLQFHVAGEEPGDYYLHIADGQCIFYEGTAEAPRLTIHTPSEVWSAISRGELDGQQAFMQGKYRVAGDFSLLLKLNAIFKAA